VSGLGTCLVTSGTNPSFVLFSSGHRIGKVTVFGIGAGVSLFRAEVGTAVGGLFASVELFKLWLSTYDGGFA
jgi:hypothetical protein